MDLLDETNHYLASADDFNDGELELERSDPMDDSYLTTNPKTYVVIHKTSMKNVHCD